MIYDAGLQSADLFHIPVRATNGQCSDGGRLFWCIYEQNGFDTQVSVQVIKAHIDTLLGQILCRSSIIAAVWCRSGFFLT